MSKLVKSNVLNPIDEETNVKLGKTSSLHTCAEWNLSGDKNLLETLEPHFIKIGKLDLQTCKSKIEISIQISECHKLITESINGLRKANETEIDKQLSDVLKVRFEMGDTSLRDFMSVAEAVDLHAHSHYLNFSKIKICAGRLKSAANREAFLKTYDLSELKKISVREFINLVRKCNPNARPSKTNQGSANLAETKKNDNVHADKVINIGDKWLSALNKAWTAFQELQKFYETLGYDDEARRFVDEVTAWGADKNTQQEELSKANRAQQDRGAA